MRTTTFVLSAALALCSAARAQQPPPALSALGFLIGDWEAVGSPPGESGAFIFSSAVQDQVIVRTSYAKYDTRDGRPASRHDDLMVIFVEDHALKADYFDSEQHVIHYSVELRGPKEAVFLSDEKANEPRYRLTYMLRSDGLLSGQFDVASPGSSDAFKSYLSWTARLRK
jgi:hypothetical protein